MAASTKDLMRTIECDENIVDLSESSESEEEAQPKKKQRQKNVNKDFVTDFQFSETSSTEYSYDTWKHVTNYIKRKSKTPVDDRILKIRQEQKIAKKKASGSTDSVQADAAADEEKSDVDEESDSESLSEDELKKDNIKVKESDLKRKCKRKKKGKEDEAVVIEDEEGDSLFQDAPPFDESATFFNMNLSRPLMRVIQSLNYIHPTPIQSATIPVALLGRDICGCAATGTGKTAAYMLPILERLLFKPKVDVLTRVLVLVPTRELGVQVFEVTKQLAQFTEIQIGLAVGGLDLKVQENVLRQNPDVVIATPGRLIDHLMNTPSFSLGSIEILVLDEADRMLDEYFAEQLKEIVKQCNRSRQTMLFSATMTEDVNDLATVSLNKPVKVFVDSNKEVAFNLRQEFVRIRPHQEGDREAILAALVCRTFQDHTMVFLPTKSLCYRLHIVLGLLGVNVGELHGKMTQPQRLHTLQKFKAAEVDVLLATDVAARGLDIHGVKTVINYTMPRTVQHYIHRVGRTARAGRAGRSVSLAAEFERQMVKELIKMARNPVKSRVIPPDIITKYRSKLENLENDIQRVIKEGQEQKELQILETQLNKTMKKLKGNHNASEIERTWFQTGKERQEEKERLNQKTDNDEMDEEKLTRKQKKRFVRTPECRKEEQMTRMTEYQVRSAKRKRKPKKLYKATDEVKTAKGKKKKQKGSSFECDMTLASKKAMKTLQQSNPRNFQKS